jgi:hypothetical protein
MGIHVAYWLLFGSSFSLLRDSNRDGAKVKKHALASLSRQDRGAVRAAH